MPRIRLDLRRSRRSASRARGLFRWRDLGAVERLLNLSQHRRFDTGAERGADNGRIDLDFLEIVCEQR